MFCSENCKRTPALGILRKILFDVKHIFAKFLQWGIRSTSDGRLHLTPMKDNAFQMLPLIVLCHCIRNTIFCITTFPPQL